MKGRKMFRKLIDLESAIEILYENYEAKPLGVEEVDILDAHNRVLAENIFSPINVPPFDKSIVDGYAVKSEDTFKAGETNPVKLKIVERIKTGYPPTKMIGRGEASEIDTGAMIPLGSDAVVPVENTEEQDGYVLIYKRVAPGTNILPAGTDISMNQLVLLKGTKLTSREIGMLSAMGFKSVRVFKKPKVAIFSIGDELKKPGETLEKGKIYDVNANLLYAAVKENGGEPIIMGIAKDSADEVINMIKRGLEIADVIVSTGSTSAGTSDIVYKVINQFKGPGMLVHGLKISPGKPTVIAIIENKPYLGLPGNPSSCINTFNLIVAPLIRRLSGIKMGQEIRKIKAKTKVRINGEVGRRIYQGVSLIERNGELHVYPLLSGSGAVTTLGSADGFIMIHEKEGYIDADEDVEVIPLAENLEPAKFVIFGPSSIKVDKAVAKIAEGTNITIKRFNTTSTASIMAIKRGEADIAGVSLIDPNTGEYNNFLIEKYGLENVELIRGFTRKVGFVSKKGEKVGSLDDIIERDLYLINQANGTEGREILEYILRKEAEKTGKRIDELKNKIRGYNFTVKNYLAAISAILNDRGDVAIAPEEFVDKTKMSFTPLIEEHYDFLIPKKTKHKELIEEFLQYIK